MKKKWKVMKRIWNKFDLQPPRPLVWLSSDDECFNPNVPRPGCGAGGRGGPLVKLYGSRCGCACKQLRIKNFIKIKWRRFVSVCNTTDFSANEKWKFIEKIKINDLLTPGWPSFAWNGTGCWKRPRPRPLARPTGGWFGSMSRQFFSLFVVK